jgi:hypothetical protein
MWLVCAALSGCDGDQPYLELMVTADEQPQTLDVVVRDQGAGQRILDLSGQIVPARDITKPGAGVQVVVWFSRGGRYLVHVVGRRQDGPPLAGTRLYDVSGHTTGALRLSVLVPGSDADGDTFPACPPVVPLPAIDCDCNDTDSTVNPAAAELCGDGRDQNCDGHDEPCRDDDGDGVPADRDCDDHDPNRFPGNHEAPNSCPPLSLADPKCGDGIDQDCDGRDVPCMPDADCDGFSPPPLGNDCDDNDPSVHPGAPEICGNGKDDNCNGLIDEGCLPCDVDGDGFLDGRRPECGAPAGQADCDDFDAGRNPAATAGCGGVEGDPRCALRQLCNGRDDDCDGMIDEGCPPAACDADHDGFQRAAPGCNPPAGAVDCDDNDPHVFPGAPDRCGDGIAQNCAADLPCTNDADGDGYNAGVDCDDTDPRVHPWAVELCNGRDDDCDGLVDEGNPDTSGQSMAGLHCFDDTDGICGPAGGSGGACVCSRVQVQGHRDPDPQKRVTCPGENLAAVVSPRCVGARQPECEACDGRDHDCDGSLSVPSCSTGGACQLVECGQPCGPAAGICSPGRVIGCDFGGTPTPNAFNPHFICSSDFIGPQPEVCDGLDDNCDGELPPGEQDPDGDHYLACTGCDPASLPPPLEGCGDCAPTNAAIHPGAVEICNGLDDDCDGRIDNNACAPGLTCCVRLAACLDLANDPNHCGMCGNACPGTISDGCAGGQCRCGGGPVCGGLSDACVGGECRCGSGPACSGPLSDRCSGGSCLCGQVSCDPQLADHCGGGQCRCGAGPACGAGASCQSGQCVCNDATGCTGCCQGGRCVAPPTANACGSGGAACVRCSGRTDTCDSSASCTCGGTGGPCAAGQLCQGGACVCNGASCPSGCCDGNDQCQGGTMNNQCGMGGTPCQMCTGGNHCVGQVCQ